MSTKNIYNAVLEFEKDSIAARVTKEIDAGTDIDEILNDGLIKAMDEVGRLFAEGELFVPEMLAAAHTMKAGLEVLKPHLAAGTSVFRGTVVIGTVKGDLHDIGKNLVAMMMEGAGFNIIDPGVDVAPEKFVAAAEESSATIICMSALLTTTMPAMAETVKLVASKGLGCKTMIGGAPVTKAYAAQIGASGYSEDAAGAVVLARKLVAA